MTDFTFDARRFTPSITCDTIPPAEYAGTVIDAEWRPARSGDGRYIQIAFRLDSGDHAGRVVFGRYHLETRVVATTAIAQREFALLCSAVGITTLTGLDQLRNRSLRITVGVKQRDGAGGAANVVTGYAPSTVPTAHAPRAKRTA